jgi:hypothetical protein
MFSALVTATDRVLPVSADRRAAIWQQSRALPTAWGRWNGYVNQLCMETCLDWLQAEYLPQAEAEKSSEMWGMVNGAIITVGTTRIALIPTEAVDRSELAVPQEWIDIPSLAADYYVGVEIAPDCESIAIYGFTTHRVVKERANYDVQERIYSLDIEELILDLNALWLALPRYTTAQTQATLPALPTLDNVQAERLIARLADPAQMMPRLAVPAATWLALMAHPQWRAKLNGNATPGLTQLSNWFRGQIDQVWQSIDRVLLPQQMATAVRGGVGDRLEIGEEDVYRAQVLNIDRGQIALVIGISPLSETETRITLLVYPAGGQTYLPGETQLRLLSEDGSEISKAIAGVAETIKLQFRAVVGEEFEIEITCGGEILRERFGL